MTVSAPLVAALMAYAVSATGLPYPEAGLPAVAFETSEEINARVYRGSPPAGEYAVACYDDEADTVVLHEDWAPTPVGMSDLLHEIVHYLQDQQDPDRIARIIETQACRGHLERPAYATQAKFLEDLGVEDPLGAMGVDLIFFLTQTSCPAR